jgi:hypothetical protein
MSGRNALRAWSVDLLSGLMWELKHKRWWYTCHSAVQVTVFLNRWCKPCCHSTTSLTTVRKLYRWYFTTTAEIIFWRWQFISFFLSLSWRQLDITIIHLSTEYRYVSHSAYFSLLNPLAYTAGCETDWAIDAFAVNCGFCVSRWHDMSYTVWKLKKRSIEWYIIHIDSINYSIEFRL